MIKHFSARYPGLLSLLLILPVIAFGSGVGGGGGAGFETPGMLHADMNKLLDKARAGDSDALLSLGVLYAQGMRVEKDLPRAVAYMTRAAEQGSLSAQYTLALLLKDGDQVINNKREAYRWMSEAAQQGHRKAMSMLGFMYLYGDGAPKDKVLAAMWFRLAHDHGGAGKPLQDIEKHMNAEEIARARTLARHMAGQIGPRQP